MFNDLAAIMLIVLSPLLVTAGLVCVAFLYAFVIKFLFITMSQVERLWGGEMFLGFASYVSPEERWYVGTDGEWHDLQEELAADLRGKDYVK